AKRLVYVRASGHSNLWLATVGVDRTQVVPKELTAGTLLHTGPSFSPDGTRVAFARGDSKTQNIFVTPANGGPAQQVTFMKSLNWSPAWSPDGRSIAFSSNEGGATKVWQVPASGGTPRSFSNTNVSPTPERLPVVWAPGRNILYQRPGNGNYYMLDPGTGGERPLSKNDSVGVLFAAVYSPDGNQVIMRGNRS